MIDSHCHLADDEFERDVKEVMGRARQCGVSTCLCILDATRPEELQRAERLLQDWPDVWFSVGVHPHRAGEAVAGSAPLPVPEGIGVSRVVALGEIGLDYHYDFAPRDVQRDVFRQQLSHAAAHDWPVVVHCREADDDVLADIASAGRGTSRGVFHCFTGDITFARRVLDIGFLLSFSGIVTFPKATELREVARYCPLDRMLVETDSPYLAPVPHRGRRNEPAHVVHVAARVAEVRGESLERLGEAVARNFARLFERTAGADSPR